MLVGAYPFEDPQDPRNFRKTIGRILSVQYSIPDYVRISADCRELLSQIFIANPANVRFLIFLSCIGLVWNQLSKLLQISFQMISSKQRLTIPEIKKHRWFLKNLPKELSEGENANNWGGESSENTQSVEEILRIIQEARTPFNVSNTVAGPLDLVLPDADDDIDLDVEDVYDSGDFVSAI
ncbi:Serine/threonine-protein kinase SAPK3 [Acorus calamus]|uniref:Serine/threonine-protein kinase SAPK3 n=1 Tax=Acorus calamus TaxID=4465 RepID=A0AAV9FLP4_ACOCL|nr:Serine/threonine-protein kinase SAPK3 [Acorus calamus]